MKNKTSIPLMIVAITTMIILLSSDNLEPAYALTIRFSDAISASSTRIIETSNGFFFYFDDTNNKFGKVRTSDGNQMFEANVSANATRGFRCNDNFCWHLTDNTASTGRLTRYSGTTGALSQTVALVEKVSGSADIGISSSTIYIGMECGAGHIGSSGAADTDYAIFSVDGTNMLGTFVQHTDCGSNFTVISTASQGVIGFERVGSFLMVVINGASGGSELVKSILLTIGLSSVSNPHICSVTLATGHNAFTSVSGQKIFQHGEYVFLGSINGADGDLDVDRIKNNTCGLNTYDFIDSTDSSFTGMDISTSNGAIYFSHVAEFIDDPAISSYNFTVGTSTPVPSVKNFDIILTSNPQGVKYITGDILVTSQLNKLTYIELGGAGEGEEEPISGQENGVCLNIDANGDGRINVLDCVGSVTAFEGFTSGQNATDVTATITDGLGLTNCGDNPDHETCGSGLFMFIFALLIFEGLSLALYLGFTTRLGAEKQLVDILLIMLMIAFATLSLAFYLNWIPDIVFYAIVVLIAGFLAFGIVAKFRGG